MKASKGYKKGDATKGAGQFNGAPNIHRPYRKDDSTKGVNQFKGSKTK